MRVIADIETDGLRPSIIHCAVMLDADDHTVYRFADQEGYLPLSEFASACDGVDQIIGHNFCNYDAPVIRRLLGATLPYTKVLDTLHATRVLWPDLRDHDKRKGLLQPKDYGKHSLFAWGVRCGVHKGDFGETTDWQSWSVEMMQYCVQDCRVNEALYWKIVELDK